MNSGSSRSKVSPRDLAIEPLDTSLDRAAFCCGVPLLDDFFHNHAADFHKAYKTRVTVALYERRIVGYYWLAVQSAAFSEFSKAARLQHEFAHTDLDTMPCVYLGMIATDRNMQGRGIGKAMMVHAMGQTLAVADRVGAYALTLEAIDGETAKRYATWGFDYYLPDRLWMYMPLSTIKEALDIAS